MSDILHLLHELVALATQINNKVNLIMATLADLTAEISAETTIDQSIVTLLDGIAAQLAAAQASNDPVAIQTVLTSLQANSKILSDAIAANTPVAPATTLAVTPPVATV